MDTVTVLMIEDEYPLASCGGGRPSIGSEKCVYECPHFVSVNGLILECSLERLTPIGQ